MSTIYMIWYMMSRFK